MLSEEATLSVSEPAASSMMISTSRLVKWGESQQHAVR
jgi:hypothetical protein